MKKGRIIFDSISGCWRRERSKLEMSDFFLIGVVLCFIACVLVLVWGKNL